MTDDWDQLRQIEEREEAYNTGWDNGYASGHKTGFEEGYSKALLDAAQDLAALGKNFVRTSKARP